MFSFEGSLKLTGCLLGLMVEVGNPMRDGYFKPYGDGQHITMYLFYGLSGATDVMATRMKFLPPDADYVALLTAVSIEALLF